METTIIYWGNIGIMENKMETTIICWGNIGIMENKMETTIIYWGNIGIMENKMETTIIWVIVPLNSSSGYTGLRAYGLLKGSGFMLQRLKNYWPS